MTLPAALRRERVCPFQKISKHQVLGTQSKPLRQHASFSVVDILIVMDCHFNYFLILNSHVIKGCTYHASPGMELQVPHTEGAQVQLALMSVES